MPQPLAKLPFWRTVTQSYVVTLRNIGALGRIGWAWTLLLGLAIFAAYWLLWPLALWPRELVTGCLSTILPLIAGACIAVGWHRHLLLGEPQCASSRLAFDRRRWRYLGWLVALTVSGFAPLVAALAYAGFPGAKPSIDQILAVLAAILACFALAVPLARLGLALPAVAIDENTKLAHIWRHTRGNTWRVAWGSLAAVAGGFLGLVVAELASLLSSVPDLPGAEETRFDYAWTNTVGTMIWFIPGFVGVTFLTLAYKHFFLQSTPSAASAGSR